MKKSTPKANVKIKVKKSKTIKKIVRTSKPKETKASRWAKISREIVSIIRCNANTYKIISTDKRSFLVLKKVFTIEIHKNDNFVHQPYRSDVEGYHYKCFLIVDGLVQNHDQITCDYHEFGVPVLPIIMPEEVKYKLASFT